MKSFIEFMPIPYKNLLLAYLSEKKANDAVTPQCSIVLDALGVNRTMGTIEFCGISLLFGILFWTNI